MLPARESEWVHTCPDPHSRAYVYGGEGQQNPRFVGMVFLESLQLNSLELNAYRAGLNCKMTSMVPRGIGDALSEEVRQVNRQTHLACCV